MKASSCAASRCRPDPGGRRRQRDRFGQGNRHGRGDRGDVWNFYLGRGAPVMRCRSEPVLTIPAAGSEASTGTVITNEAGWLKRAVNSELIYPRFSFLNP